MSEMNKLQNNLSVFSPLEPLEPRLLLDVSGVWDELGYRGASGGGISYDTTESLRSDMAININGHPVVAWENGYGATHDIYVVQYNGLNWTPLGTGAASGTGIGQGHSPRVAVDKHTGTVYVAWVSGTPEAATTEIYLKYWDGQSQTWKELGGSATAGGISNDSVISEEVTLAIGEDSIPIVAYRGYDEESNDFDIICKKWSGQGWGELTSSTQFPRSPGAADVTYGGGVSNDVFNSFSPSLAIGPDNAPVLAWASRPFAQDAEIYLRRWNGSEWETLGNSASDPGSDPVPGISNTAGESVAPKVVVGPDPSEPGKVKIIVGWQDYSDWLQTSQAAIYVRQYDSQTDTWTEITAGSASGDGITGARARFPDMDMVMNANGLPIVAYASKVQPADDQYRGFVMEATIQGGNVVWTYLSDPAQDVDTQINPEAQEVRWPQLGVLPSGKPVITYTNLLMDLAVLDPEPSAPRTGVVIDFYDDPRWPGRRTINAPYDAYHMPFDYAFASSGVAVIDSEIYVQQWTGSAWTELGTGSSNPGGVENSAGDLGLDYNSPPQAAVDGTGAAMIAYLERVSEPSDRYQGHLEPRVLRYNESTRAWEQFPRAGALPEISNDIIDAPISGPYPYVNRGGQLWYSDMLLISSDANNINNFGGVTAVAYVDTQNLNDPDPLVNGHSTITVLVLNDQGTPSDFSDDTWDRMGTGTTGLGAYAYVSPDTVANGWLIDQVNIVSWRDGKVALFWRQVDPTGTAVSQMSYDQVTGVATGAAGGSSEVWGTVWDPSNSEWTTFSGAAGAENLTVTWGEYKGLNFSPSSVVTSSGEIVLSFTAGKIARMINTGLKDVQDEDVPLPYLKTDIAVWRLGATGWVNMGGLASPGQAGEEPDTYLDAPNTYRDPSIAVGLDGRPIPVWTHETQQLMRYDPDPDVKTYVPADVRPSQALSDAAKAVGDPAPGAPAPGDPVLTSHVVMSAYWRTVASDIVSARWTAQDVWAGMPGKDPATPITTNGQAIMPSVYGNGSQFPTVAWTDAILQGNAAGWGAVAGTGFPITIDAVFTAVFDDSGNFQGWEYDPIASTFTIPLGLPTDLLGIYSPPPYSTFDKRGYYGDHGVSTEMTEYIVGQPLAPMAPASYRNEPTAAGSEHIFVKRWNPNIAQWEELLYKDAAGQSQQSAQGTGISQGWGPGNMPSVAIHTTGQGTLLQSQPIVVWNNMYNESVFARQWVHEGLTPQLQVTENSGTPNDGRLEFGDMLLGQKGQRLMMLNNTGAGKLVIDSITSDLVGQFYITDVVGNPVTLPLTIEARSSLGLLVNADPTDAGLFTHYLKINSSDPVQPETIISIVGARTGQAQIAVDERVGAVGDMVLPFDLVSVGQTVTRSFDISNTGTDPLNITELAISGVNRNFVPWIQATRNVTGLTAGLPIYGGNGDSESAAQSFQIANSAMLHRVQLYLNRTGSPMDNIHVAIEADNGGEPSGVPIAGGLSNALSAASVGGGANQYGWYDLNFTDSPTLVANQKYWLVVLRSGARDDENYINWGYDGDAASYADGQLVANSTGVWDTATYVDGDALFAVGTVISTATIPPSQSLTVNIDFTGDANTADGVIAYATIRHDDFLQRGTPATRATNPITLVLTANKPDFQSIYTAGAGTNPAVGRNGISWTGAAGIDLLRLIYPNSAGLPATLISQGAGTFGRSQTDGNYVVWEQNDAIWCYDLTTNSLRNLTGTLPGADRSVSISNGRIVYATANAGGTWNINMMNLATNQVTAIPKVVPGNTDFWPTIDGDLIAWRSTPPPPPPPVTDPPTVPTPVDPADIMTTSAYTNKVIFAYRLPSAGQTSTPFQVNAGNVPGPQIPVVSDGRIVWTEQGSGGYQLRYVDTILSQGGVVLDQAEPISAIPSIDGTALAWASQKSGNWDLYCYYFNLRPGEELAGPVLRDRVFRLSYSAADQINPTIYGSLIAYQEQTATSDQVRYGRLPGFSNLIVEETSGAANDSTLEFGKAYLGFPKTLSLTISNNGTEDAVISEITADDSRLSFTNGTGQLIPADYVLPSGQSLTVLVTVTDDGTLNPLAAHVSILSDDWDTPVLTVDVTGTFAVPTAPTATTVTPLGGAIEDQDFTITYASLLAASDANDADGDPISFRIGGVLSGTLTKNGQAVVPGTTMLGVGESLVWRPAVNANGTLAAFNVKAWDGYQDSNADVPVSVVVAAVNDAPTLTTMTMLGLDPAAEFTITFEQLLAASNAADVELDALSFRIESVLAGTLLKNNVAVLQGVTLIGPGESVVWRPATPPAAAVNAFTVTAWDGQASSGTPVTVTAKVNHAPTLTTMLTRVGATEDQDFSITYALLTAAGNEADSDGDPISFRVETVSSGTLTKNGVPVIPGTTLVEAADRLVWHPDANANGVLNAFTVVAWDGRLASSAPVQVKVDVAAVNDAPTLTTVNKLVGATEEQPFTISYNMLAAAADAADVDMDTISFRVETISSGTLTKGGSPVVVGTSTAILRPGESFIWTPAANTNGDVTAFTVKAFDDRVASTTAMPVAVAITPVNDAPSAQNLNTRTAEETPILLALAGSDVETAYNDLVFNVPNTSVNGGTLTRQANGQYLYTPAPAYNGIDSFTYTVTDTGDQAGSNNDVKTSQQVTVTIQVGQQMTIGRLPVTFMDTDGDVITVTLRGGGSGTLYFPTSGRLDLSGIELRDTTTKSTLQITAKTASKTHMAGTSLRRIIVHGAIGTINAPTTSMNNGSITLDQAVPGAAVTKVALGQVSDVSVDSLLPIKTLSAIEWLDTDDSDVIEAPWIGTLRMLGRKANATLGVAAKAGNFQPDLVLTDGTPKLTLGTAKIAGDMISSDWAITGNLGTLTVTGSVIDSNVRTTGNMNTLTLGAADHADFLAGIANGVARHADSHDDFVNPAATIKTVKIAGLKTGAAQSFTDSNFSAGIIRTVKLLNTMFDNDGDEFGLFSCASDLVNPVTSVTYKDSLPDNNWTWKPGSALPYAVGDLRIRIL